jgi:hypothetical protein
VTDQPGQPGPPPEGETTAAEPPSAGAAAPTTTVDVGEIIRIVDSELDVDAIMAQIRANLAGRAPLDPDPSGLVYRPGEAALLSAQGELEWELDQAIDAQRDLGVADQLRRRAGLFGALANRARAPLHQVARFYVDLSVQKQAVLQGHVVRALRLLSQQAVARQEETARLRAEVEELRRELAALRGEGK